MTAFAVIPSLRIATLTIAILCVAGTATAKCQTSELVVRGARLADKLTITAADGAGQFNIWNGPRVRMNNESIHRNPAYSRGNFIDWQLEALAASPEDPVKFQISFFCVFDERAGPREVYSVDYSFSPGVDGGHIHLPGKDDTRYISNVATIVHGIEGSWYHSTREWESIIRPVLENAIGKQRQ